MPEKTRLIEIISSHSDRYGDRLLDFMRRYGLRCLASATVPQLKEFIQNNYPEEML